MGAAVAMNLLLIPANYPCPASPQIGAQNERCACVLARFVNRIAVVSPRPFIPSFMAFRLRWQCYASIPHRYVSRGIEVYRPSYFVMPGLMQAFWPNQVAYYALRPLMRQLHQRHHFDAILSFDIRTVGGLAWRLGQDLGIPAAGWAVGSDIRNSQDSPFGRRVAETLQKLDLVFYQSSELLQLGAQILAVTPEQLQRSGRHRILSRGVMEAEIPPDNGVRAAVRAMLHVADDEVMILYLGRIIHDKGLFGLVDVLASHSEQIGNLKLVLVGAAPAFDHTAEFKKYLRQYPVLLEKVYVLSACAPEEIWKYFAAADIFAFPSLKEGMPNSPLEAMIAGLPVVAFDIPAIREIAHYDHEALFAVSDFNYDRFFDRLILLANDQQLRKLMGTRGRKLVQQHFSLLQNMKSASTYLNSMT
jgi:teichuronic acid biosynthesis glycosyltransferase TuaC